MTPLVAIINGKEKHLGYLDGTNFHKRVQFSKHFYRKNKSWCIDYELARLLPAMSHHIYIEDTEKGVIYDAPVSVLRKAKQIEHEPHGKQLSIETKYFTQRASGNRRKA